MRVAVVCTLIFCASAHAQQQVGGVITGEATTVVDGNTFRIRYDRITIWGIDTPEWRARCITSGQKWQPTWGSHAQLTECLRGTKVTCRVQKVEPRFARPRFVAECWRDDNKDDIATCMVRSGWATDFPGYSGGHYAGLEDEPKTTRRGLWQCDGGPPTRRWCGGGPCERPIYKPRGPAGAGSSR